MVEYIKIGASTIITAISIVMYIIASRKKGNNKKLYEIVQKIPKLITEAEEVLGTGTGTAKLRYVLREIQIMCLNEEIEFKEEQMKTEIENILSTPQKKEN